MLSIVQTGHREREARTKVLVPCRMQADGNWADACIHNISSRGMMVAVDEPPRPGSYVDIRRGKLVVIGRVMWRRDRFFGVRTQDRISVDAVVNEPRRNTAPAGTPERRAEARHVADAKIARRIERHRQLSSLIQYGSMVCGALFVAGLVAMHIFSLLNSSLGTVRVALAGGAG
jgi:hypothetical protein